MRKRGDGLSTCSCRGPKHPNAVQCSQCRNRKWTAEEEAILQEMTEAGIDSQEISAVLGRSKFGCRARACKLGLTKPRNAVLENRKKGQDKFWNNPERVAQWKERMSRQFTSFDRNIRAEELRQRNRNGTTSFKGKTHTPEAREQIRQAHIGRKFTDEHRAKISRGRKRYWARWRVANGRPAIKKLTGRKRNAASLPTIYGLPVSMTLPQTRRGECRVGDKIVRLSPFLTRFLEVLLIRGPIFSTYDELVEMLWPNPDDEPSDGVNLLKVRVYHLRQKGIAISTWHGFGIKLSQFDLRN